MDAISSKLNAIEAFPERKLDMVPIDEDYTKRFAQRVKDNREIDYDEARSNFKTLIKEGMAAVPKIMDLAKEAESARMFEAASAFIKTLSEINKEMLDLIPDEKAPTGKKGIVPALEAEVPTEAGVQTVFIGSTEQLFDEMARRARMAMPQPIDVGK